MLLALQKDFLHLKIRGEKVKLHRCLRKEIWSLPTKHSSLTDFCLSSPDTNIFRMPRITAQERLLETSDMVK